MSRSKVIPLENKKKPLSSKEKKTVSSLNEIWGNDKEGIYEKHYERLVKEKSPVLLAI